MDGDSSCQSGSSDDVTGGGEKPAFNTKEDRSGHLGGSKVTEEGQTASCMIKVWADRSFFKWPTKKCSVATTIHPLTACFL